MIFTRTIPSVLITMMSRTVAHHMSQVLAIVDDQYENQKLQIHRRRPRYVLQRLNLRLLCEYISAIAPASQIPPPADDYARTNKL